MWLQNRKCVIEGNNEILKDRPHSKRQTGLFPLNTLQFFDTHSFVASLDCETGYEKLTLFNGCFKNCPDGWSKFTLKPTICICM